jgi:hypothetical protein
MSQFTLFQQLRRLSRQNAVTRVRHSRQKPLSTLKFPISRKSANRNRRDGLAGCYEKLFRTMRRNFPGSMMFDSEAGGEHAPKLGRRTIEDGLLSSNRDALVGMLSAWWPHVGWELKTATEREHLQKALLPLRDHPNRYLIDRLSRRTELTAMEAPEIRKKRAIHGEAVTRRRSSQIERDRFANECRELEAAISAAKSDQVDGVLREFLRQGTAYHTAHTKALIAEKEEEAIEKELLEMESAFAQDELLTFIKGKYANNPLNLANAMAGLPYAIDVPFLGAGQSHARCSQLKCPGWPSYHYQVFEIIQSIWETSEHSTLPTLEFFRQQIRSLPKTVIQTDPTMGRHKCDNYVRAYLSENWWDLERAIKVSLETKNDPRPMYFVIAANLDVFVGQPKTLADVALAKAARLRD